MKKNIIIVLLGIMVICSYFFGRSQAETITEIQTIEKPVEIVKEIKIIPDNYIDTTSYNFYNNYIDMRKVVDFTANNDGLQIILNDGSGYYWER